MKFSVFTEEKNLYILHGYVFVRIICKCDFVKKKKKKTRNKKANHNTPVNLIFTGADPEIFMRGGPTKMLIFGHRRGGVQPPKNPEITFF